MAGIRSFRFGRSVYEQFAGCIRESQKDGSEQIIRGEPIFSPQEVDTFDCQCLIVHSCLIKEYNLRFDENLTFDLYGEELSIGARENYGIRSCVVPLACQHYSRGRLSQRFTDGIEYLNRKYAGAKRVYANVVSPSMLVYNRKKHKRLKPVMYRESFLNFLFSRKITRSGRMQIKICKLPVASIKMCK